MRELGPDRLSKDGRFLFVRDPGTAETFRISTDRLQPMIDAARRVRTPGQMEITMESTLSPRDIQTRIRRGESIEEVASAAGVETERVLVFAGPVVAEREYMAEQAQRTAVRRQHAGGSTVPLGELVGEQLAGRGETADDVIWDAWRREDGRWTVTAQPAADDAPAFFVYDVKGRYVLPSDERALALVDDLPPQDDTDMAIADALRGDPAGADPTASQQAAGELDSSEPGAAVRSLKEARDRRAMEQLVLGEESRVSADAPLSTAEHFTEVPDADPPLRDDAGPDTVPAEAEPSVASEASGASVQEIGEDAESTAGPRRKKNERRRVPSWDEIMFGSRAD